MLIGLKVNCEGLILDVTLFLPLVIVKIITYHSPFTRDTRIPVGRNFTLELYIYTYIRIHRVPSVCAFYCELYREFISHSCEA